MVSGLSGWGCAVSRLRGLAVTRFQADAEPTVVLARLIALTTIVDTRISWLIERSS